jgi:hypothetical protein
MRTVIRERVVARKCFFRNNGGAGKSKKSIESSELRARNDAEELGKTPGGAEATGVSAEENWETHHGMPRWINAWKQFGSPAGPGGLANRFKRTGSQARQGYR